MVMCMFIIWISQSHPPPCVASSSSAPLLLQKKWWWNFTVRRRIRGGPSSSGRDWSRIRGKWKANWMLTCEMTEGPTSSSSPGRVAQGYRLAHLAGSVCVAIILAKWVAVEGYFLMRAECAKRESGWKGWWVISVSVYVGSGYLLLASACLIRRPCSWPHIRYKGASTYVHLNPSAHPPLLLVFCAWTRLELTF